MKFVSNAGTDRVLDLVRLWLKSDHQLGDLGSGLASRPQTCADAKGKTCPR